MDGESSREPEALASQQLYFQPLGPSIFLSHDLKSSHDQALSLLLKCKGYFQDSRETPRM